MTWPRDAMDDQSEKRSGFAHSPIYAVFRNFIREFVLAKQRLLAIFSKPIFLACADELCITKMAFNGDPSVSYMACYDFRQSALKTYNNSCETKYIQPNPRTGWLLKQDALKAVGGRGYKQYVRAVISEGFILHILCILFLWFTFGTLNLRLQLLMTHKSSKALCIIQQFHL